MRALINIDFDDETSRQLSMVRYYECVTDRLKEKGEQIFNEILAAMNLRY
jgi:predicted fused transcriptional regulator/phosphomethylpyrimidine kinase